eukprot:TRINITY_DN73375_c0_g1_i2.p1 TRINITY_DN73375_c0_g1~~TRINITY_DN73375_c0_g1_i2.p1  ORF type:complete len:374 (-),score=92.72 TRINITY_DN73375_c0_g1_i2:41-1162(-)
MVSTSTSASAASALAAHPSKRKAPAERLGVGNRLPSDAVVKRSRLPEASPSASSSSRGDGLQQQRRHGDELEAAGKRKEVGGEGQSAPAVALDARDTKAFAQHYGRLIWRVGIDLKLQTVTVATACQCFQRFFLQEDQATFDVFNIAVVSVWLATKCQEDEEDGLGRRIRGNKPRLRDIANSFYALTGRQEEAKALQMEDYWILRDNLVQYEQVLLRAMGFDCEPTTAYIYLLEFAWLLNCHGCSSLGSSKRSTYGVASAAVRGGPKPSDKEQGVVALAWSLLNDAFCSQICALSSPARLAMACLLVAVELSRRAGSTGLKAEAATMAKCLDALSREPGLEDFLGLGAESGAEEMEELCQDLLSIYEPPHRPM